MHLFTKNPVRAFRIILLFFALFAEFHSYGYGNSPGPIPAGEKHPFKGQLLMDNHSVSEFRPGWPVTQKKLPKTGNYCNVNWDNSFNTFPANDDNEFSVALPFSFNLYGDTYESVRINNNGFLIFSGSASYSPQPFPYSGAAMIAPFWGDVFTSDEVGGLVHYKVEANRLTVVWDQVGKSGDEGEYNTFQVIITDGSDPSIGMGQNVAFSYGDMQWPSGNVGMTNFDSDYEQVGYYTSYGMDDASGIDNLDYQCFVYNLSTEVANLPPVAQGFPASNNLNLYVGETISLPITFSSPESNQVTQISTNAASTPGFSVLSYTSGNAATMTLQFIGTAANAGSYPIEFTAMDNGSPAQTTTLTLTVNVLPLCSLAKDASFTAIPANDDDFTTVSLPFAFKLYGTTYTSAQIGTNGVVTFGGTVGYNPVSFPQSGAAVVAPFWADAHTGRPGSGLVYYKVEPTRLTIVWDHVYRSSSSDTKSNTYKTILTNGMDPILSVGKNVAFAYGDMQWTTSGSSGYGSPAAVVGFNKGDNSIYQTVGMYSSSGTGAGGVDFLDNQCFQYKVDVAASVLTLPVSNLGTYCSGSALQVAFAKSGGFAGNETFTIQRSDLNATTFPTTPVILGSGTQTPLQAVIPAGTAAGNYQVRVVSPGGVVSNSQAFIVSGTNCNIPIIASITPTSGPVGTSITIQGNNFNATAASNLVYFGATKAIVTGASATQLTVTVPAGATSVSPIHITNSETSLTGTSARTTPFPIQFTVTFPNGLVNNTSFVKSDIAVGAGPRGIAAADFNGDGKLDLATANFSASTVSILLRNATNTGFDATSDIAVSANPFKLATTDFNNDGKMDLVCLSNTTVTILAGSGNGTFTITQSFTVGYYATQLAIGDLTADGYPDLVISISSNNPESVSSKIITLFNTTLATPYNNTPNPTFKFVTDVTQNPVGLSIWDFNRDGKLDLAYVDAITKKVYVLMNIAPSPGLLFGSSLEYALGNSAKNIAMGDINKDGQMDMVVDSFGIPAYLLQSSNNITFEAPVSFGRTMNSYGIVTGDFNGDGRVDVAGADAVYGNIRIFVWDTCNTAFGPSKDFATAFGSSGMIGPYDLVTGDFNGDGRPDLATPVNSANQVSILTYQNQNSIKEIVLSTLANASVCAGDSTALNFTPSGAFNNCETYTAQLSQLNSTSFTSPILLGTKPTGPIKTVIPPETVAGNYNIRILSSSGAVSNLIQVTVKTTPTVTLASSDADNTICAGQSVTFTATATGATSYQFFVGATSVQSGPANTYVTSSLTTGQIVKAIASHTSGCSKTSSTITTTVSNPPMVTIASNAADNTICTGQSVTFTATATGATSYQFFVGTSPVQNGAAATYVTSSLTTGQTVKVIASNSSGCSTTSAFITTTVNPRLSVSLASSDADGNICPGQSVTFTATASGNNTYLFYVGNSLMQSGPSNIFITSGLTGTQSVTVQLSNNCSWNATQTITVISPPPASLMLLRRTSCGTATDGKLRLNTATSATSYVLYRNGVADAAVPISGSTYYDIANLTTGVTYAVEVKNQYGCSSTSNSMQVDDGSPQVAFCTAQLFCQSGTSGKVYFNITYSQPSANFANKYQYRLLKNGAEVIPLKIAVPNNPNPTSGLYGDPSAVYYYVETIPNAQVGEVYTLELSALVERTVGCNCYDPYCTKPFSFTFSQATPSLALNTTLYLNGTPTYYVCDDTGKAGVSVSFTQSLSDCSAPLQGYRLTMSQNGGIAQILADTSAQVRGIGIQQNLSLLPGDYSLTGEAGTGNYHCLKTLTFKVISLRSVKISVNTTPADCHGGAAIASVSGGVGEISYRWYRKISPTNTLQSITSQGATVVATQVEGLLAGNYVMEVRLKGNGLNCTSEYPFTIDSLAPANPPVVALAKCGATAKAKLPIGTAGSGRYRMDWYRYAPVPMPRQDSLVFTEFVGSKAYAGGDSLISALPELLADSANYYVVLTNERGCRVTSPVAYLKKIRFARSYQLCLQWQTPVLPPKAKPTLSTRTLESIAATDLRDAIEEKMYGCVIKQQKLVAANIGVNCISPGAVRDSLTVTYNQQYHHYTLYYYDRGGNLTKTIPPQGVRPLAANLTSRANTPAHEYATIYRYNSLGQLMHQFTPDGDTTNFVYNRQGQLRFSQNARQKIDKAYSYTKYDELGRVNEVGEATKKGTQALPAFNASVNDNTSLLAVDTTLGYAQKFPVSSSAYLNQQTITVYNTPANVTYPGASSQRYLLNRVSYTYTYNKADSIHGVYTYYSYDPHGNVEWLAQDIPELPRTYVAYEYDLISGKVLKVKYNESLPDRFFHRYGYDEDNRLTLVETSRDGYVWDRDASYAYYAHGPLQRTGIGEDHVQGLDYTYTIQGWLKGINTTNVSGATDLGADGENASSPFSKDVFGMALSYYKGDYVHPGSVFQSAIGAVNQFNLSPEKDLYNGNIAAWASQTSGRSTEGDQYQYDRLNRLKTSNRSVLNTSTGQWQKGAALSTNYSYDANGNLLTLNRKDDLGNRLDSLTYAYQTVNGRKTNRLSQVQEQAAATSYKDDLEGTHQYEYDAIGNLVQDKTDSVQINWNVYGKVSEVKPLNGSKKPTVRYLYDAAGNRISKRVKTPTITQETFYVRDASGNPMAIYQREGEDTLTTRMIEEPIYGSDRLGMRQEVIYLNSSVPNASQVNSYTWTKVSGPATTLSDANTPTLSVSSLVPGSYVFRLTVTDKAGATAYDEVSLTVKEDALTKGLIGYWPFNETSGTTAFDASGVGNHGTLVNGPVWTPNGRVGGALEMTDNLSRYVNVPSLTWQPTTFTVAWWINPYSRANYNQQMMSTNVWGGFVFHTSANGEIYTGTDGTNRLDNTYLPAGTLEINQWQHFVFTFESGIGKLYKNGQLIASKPGMVTPNAWTGFLIGVGNTSSVHGKIDEVRVYNRALNSTDVATLAAWNNGNTIAAPTNTGTLPREYWAGYTGTLSGIPVNTTPTSVIQVTALEEPTAVADNFGSRVRGYVYPPTTGSYTFWIAGDEQGELWLSTNDQPASKVRIAFFNAPTGQRIWNAVPEQQSAPVNLEAGKKYYVEVLHKENTGTDYLAVGWQLPGGVQERPIPGSRLAPFNFTPTLVNQLPVVSLSAPLKNAAYAVGDSLVMSALATDSDGSIRKVEFYADTLKLGVDSTAQYGITWKNVPAGVYRLTAKATDNTGATTVSDAITVYVGSQALASQPRVNAGFDQSLTLPLASAIFAGRVQASPGAERYFMRSIGTKLYELKDHLGNVRATVGDDKKANLSLTGSTLNLALIANLKGYSNYYAFGMLQPGGFYDATASNPVNGGLTLTNTTSADNPNIATVSNTFTVEAWVNPTTTHEIDAESIVGTTGIAGQTYAIAPSYTAGLGTGHVGMGISVGTNGVSVYEHGNGYLPALLVWSGTVSGWTHIAVVYENKQPRLYINGKLVRVGKTSPMSFVHPSYGFTGGYYGTFPGKIDEVRVWNRARSAADIVTDQKRSLTASASLVGYWPLDEGAGTIAYDRSGNGRNCTLSTAATWLTPSMAPIEMPLSQAGYRFGFNGKEKDSEGMGGGGSTYDYGFRIYNPRIGKFLSVDPLTSSYPELTPYQFASNTPIQAVDLDGREIWHYTQKAFTYVVGESTIQKSTSLRVVNRILEHAASMEPQRIAENLVKDPAGTIKAAERAVNPVTNTYDAVEGVYNTAKGIYNNQPEAYVDGAVIVLGTIGGYKAAKAKTPTIAVNETGGLSNLGEIGGNGRLSLSHFEPGPQTGFSGAYDVETGTFVMYPSADPAIPLFYKDGTAIPNNLRVNQLGGHRNVNNALTRIGGSPTGTRVGFSITFDEAGVLKIGFNSTQINTPNFGNRTAPVEHQGPIINALKKEFSVDVKKK